MGSRRLGWAGGGGGGCGGCPLPVPATPTPIPAASRALRLGELLNLLAAVFSFFFFCYTENKKKKDGHEGQKGKFKRKIIIKDQRKWRLTKRKGQMEQRQSSRGRNSPAGERQEESSVLNLIILKMLIEAE